MTIRIFTDCKADSKQQALALQCLCLLFIFKDLSHDVTNKGRKKLPFFPYHKPRIYLWSRKANSYWSL